MTTALPSCGTMTEGLFPLFLCAAPSLSEVLSVFVLSVFDAFGVYHDRVLLDRDRAFTEWFNL